MLQSTALKQSAAAPLDIQLLAAIEKLKLEEVNSLLSQKANPSARIDTTQNLTILQYTKQRLISETANFEKISQQPSASIDWELSGMDGFREASRNVETLSVIMNALLIKSKLGSLAFLEGTHSRLGTGSPVSVFHAKPTFDRNLLRLLLEVAGKVQSKKKISGKRKCTTEELGTLENREIRKSKTEQNSPAATLAATMTQRGGPLAPSSSSTASLDLMDLQSDESPNVTATTSLSRGTVE